MDFFFYNFYCNPSNAEEVLLLYLALSEDYPNPLSPYGFSTQVYTTWLLFLQYSDVAKERRLTISSRFEVLYSSTVQYIIPDFSSFSPPTNKRHNGEVEPFRIIEVQWSYSTVTNHH